MFQTCEELEALCEFLTNRPSIPNSIPVTEDEKKMLFA